MEVLTRKEVSELLKIPIRTIDYLVLTKQIPYSRIGKRGVRFDSDRLKKWFNERECIEFKKSRK